MTSDGRLRSVARPASSSSTSQSTTPTPDRINRRRPDLQQVTPESSPESGNKRKRSADADDSTAHGVIKKRSVSGFKDDGTEIQLGVPTAIPTPKTTPPTSSASTSTSSQNQITLRLFVRELLRRSKTSCNTLEVALCYLDGIEQEVRKLRDCMKLGITFGTVAMAERGPYDEGMKDEGRIIKYDEWKAQGHQIQDQQADIEDDEVRGEWNYDNEPAASPLSPLTDFAFATAQDSKSTTKAASSQPTSQVLATHPLLDARRTFLASLVLATKFMQDKAYSNKAWAKLSGLAGKEVGRCERALGGALQWRLWVGKDFGLNKSATSTPSTTAQESESVATMLEAESVVHGKEDPIAEALMSQASEAQAVAAQVPSAPVCVAQMQADTTLAARAACGRARTWPSLDSHFASSTRSTPCATLADQLAAVQLQSSGLLPPMSAPPFANWPMSSSPSVEEDLLEAILRVECPTVLTTPATVKMNVDDGSEAKTPYLSMNGSFSQPEPPLGFIDSWSTAASFPFTFTIPPPAAVAPQQSSQQWRNGKYASLDGRLLHPQAAALRASSASGSSSSPHSASTFSSPEVLTPIHTRANTLVDGMDYADCTKVYTGCGAELQSFMDNLYAGSRTYVL